MNGALIVITNDLMTGWTSENSEIDEIIKNTQRAANRFNYPCLKWIPPDQIQNFQKIGIGGFGIVYSADWLDGKGEKKNQKGRHALKLIILMKIFLVRYIFDHSLVYLY
jgi:hypothetical protein